MNIAISRQGQEAVMTVSGRLDMVASPQLEQAFRELFKKGFSTLTMDLAELEYISSTGLRVILAAQKRCKAIPAVLKVRNASAPVAEVFEITGFSSFLTIG